jgi:hypothetical protein
MHDIMPTIAEPERKAAWQLSIHEKFHAASNSTRLMFVSRAAKAKTANVLGLGASGIFISPSKVSGC